jgi:hypothetical protein
MASLFASKGLTLANLNNKECKEYCLGGAYRHIIQVPTDLSWYIKTYTDTTAQLVDTDLDILKAEAKV